MRVHERLGYGFFLGGWEVPISELSRSASVVVPNREPEVRWDEFWGPGAREVRPGATEPQEVLLEV